jgi:predicted RNA-binding Zn-ribbon protein involved in translation (DUF1610 family)
MKQKIAGRARGMADVMLQIGLAILQEERENVKGNCPECGNETTNYHCTQCQRRGE